MAPVTHPAHVRAAIPDGDFRVDPARRGGRFRTLSMGRRRAHQERNSQRAFRSSGGWRQLPIMLKPRAGSRVPALPTIRPVVARRIPGRSTRAMQRSSTFIRLPISRATVERAAPAGSDTEFRTRLFVQSQASTFNASGDVWAPRYRQAAFGAFLLNSRMLKRPWISPTPTYRRRSTLHCRGRRPTDHPCRAQPGRTSSRAAAKGANRGQADREEDRRGLCRWLADQHDGGPTCAWPSGRVTRPGRPAASCRG